MYPFGMLHFSDVFLRMRQTCTTPSRVRRAGMTATCLGRFSDLPIATLVSGFAALKSQVLRGRSPDTGYEALGTGHVRGILVAKRLEHHLLLRADAKRKKNSERQEVRRSGKPVR